MLLENAIMLELSVGGAMEILRPHLDSVPGHGHQSEHSLL